MNLVPDTMDFSAYMAETDAERNRKLWSPEAEQSVLGGLMLDNGAWDRVSDMLTGPDFFSHVNRVIYETIGAAVNACKPVDQITMAAALRRLGRLEECGGESYLNALAQSVPSAANIRRYAEIVRERSADRALVLTADAATTIALGDGEVAAKLDTITTMFGQMERRGVRQMPKAMDELVVARIDHYQALEDGSVKAGWPTHIPSLDAALVGGLRPGALYILAARPSVGKSSFVESIALGLARDNLPVLFLSQEMPASEVTDRAVCNLGRVSYSALMTGKIGDEDWGRVSEAVEKLGRMSLWIDDQAALTIADIRVKAKGTKGLKVLVLDYLQLCGGTRRDGNRNSEIEEISRGLKTLAKDLGIAVIALSQLNREVEKRVNKRPQLSDLRDSGAIEQDADVVLFLWPVREFEGEGRKIIGLGIDKNRQGRTGSDFGLDFHGDQQRWGESAADIRPPLPTSKRKKDFDDDGPRYGEHRQ